IAVLALSLCAGAAVAARTRRGRLALLWLGVPIAALAVLSAGRSGYHAKLLLPAAPALALLLATGLEDLARLPGIWLRFRRRSPGRGPGGSVGERRRTPDWILRGVFVCAFALALLPALADLWTDPAQARDDYRGLATFIQSYAAGGD